MDENDSVNVACEFGLVFADQEAADTFARHWDPEDKKESWTYLCPWEHWHTKPIGKDEKNAREEIITKLDLRNRIDLSRRKRKNTTN